MEFAYEYDNLSRQLDLLRDANRRLQDTNDGLRNIVDVNPVREYCHSIGGVVIQFELSARPHSPLKRPKGRNQSVKPPMQASISDSRSTTGSPRLGGRHEFTSLGSCGGAPPDILRSPSDNEIAERFYARSGGGRRRRRKKRSEDNHMDTIKHIFDTVLQGWVGLTLILGIPLPVLRRMG